MRTSTLFFASLQGCSMLYKHASRVQVRVADLLDREYFAGGAAPAGRT